MNKKTLFVDDNPFNLDILNTILRKNNYKTMLAKDGVRAWDLLKAEPERYSLSF